MSALNASYEDQDHRFAPAFAVLEEAIARRAFPGAAIAVTCRGKLVALKGFGRFTYDADSPAVDAATAYDLASVTKVVATTTAAMILWERGRLDLEMPLAPIVPEFAPPAPGDIAGARRQDVTLRMLLEHASGLPAYVKLFTRAQGRQQMVAAASAVALEALPGTRAEYSDIGFILLGEALTRLSGETLAGFCRREVFGPLGMACTLYRPPADARPLIPPTEIDAEGRVIQGVVQDENARAYAAFNPAPPADSPADAGHAGLFAPAADIAAFAECMLRIGEPILRRDSIERFTRRVQRPAGSSRALGWDTPSTPSQSGRYFSPSSYGHLGYAGTSLWVDPMRGLSVTLLTNRTWPDRTSEQIKTVRPRFHDAVGECLK